MPPRGKTDSKDILDERRRFTNGKLHELRKALEDELPEDCTLVVYGSYGRLEACEHSDLDHVLISQRGKIGDEVERRIGEILKRYVNKEPAKGGAFGKPIESTDLTTNIGGNEDTNENITRRMLFLLEGNWLLNEEGFRSLRRGILERYVPEDIRDHQLAMLLLNDIIRYWRTMAVDYAHKTQEEEKPWAIRNIKLVFSRKLIYASGLFSVAMTADRARRDKLDVLESLFSMPPMERLEEVCGASSVARLRTSYAVFLGKLSDRETREHLERLPETARTDEKFRRLKNEGHRFGQELMRLFEQTFPSSHPIRHAVIF